MNEAYPHGCEEAADHSGDTYFPCNAPAVRLVHHAGDRRTYRMCAAHANHNIKNRGGEDRGPYSRGDNTPPLYDQESYAALEAKVREWSGAAGDWLDRKTIATAEEAGQAKDLVAGARAIAKLVEAKRKDAKAPHLANCQTIDTAFSRLNLIMNRLVERIEPMARDWLERERKRLRDEQDKERIAAAAALAEAQRKTEAARARNDVAGEVENEKAAEVASKAFEATLAPVRSTITSASGGGGKATTLHQRRLVRIDNIRLAFTEVQDDALVIAAIQSALNARVRAKSWPASATIRGCTIYTQEKAV